MRRQGCALFFGLLVGGAAIAQPPADLERYPPAPELPGVVVGKTPSDRPVVSASPLTVRRTSLKPTESEPGPLSDKALPPASSREVTATIAPTESNSPTSEVAATCPATPAKCAKSCTGGIIDWLCFRSKARQSGCLIPPYMPPLQAWFPCDPHKGGCASCAAGAKACCTAPAATATGPVVIPPTTLEYPIKTGEEPGKTEVKGPDEKSGFRPVDVGLSFAPGAAPTSSPTTQTDRVSTWRPK
jgi:hypothetical protein